MNKLDREVFDVLTKSGQPMTVSDVSRALGRSGWSSDETVRAALNGMADAGKLAKVGNYAKTYEVVIAAGIAGDQEGCDRSSGERFAVEVPRLGHEGITDRDVLDEIEAEKVWTVAAWLRGGNTAWGIDMGIDADVREARALMAEARRQVRERAPIGEHYREGEPAPTSSSEADEAEAQP